MGSSRCELAFGEHDPEEFTVFQTIRVMQAWMASRARSEEGATMVEYGLLLALIAVVVAVAATLLGTSIATLFDNVRTSL